MGLLKLNIIIFIGNLLRPSSWTEPMSVSDQVILFPPSLSMPNCPYMVHRSCLPNCLQFARALNMKQSSIPQVFYMEIHNLFSKLDENHFFLSLFHFKTSKIWKWKLYMVGGWGEGVGKQMPHLRKFSKKKWSISSRLNGCMCAPISPWSLVKGLHTSTQWLMTLWPIQWRLKTLMPISTASQLIMFNWTDTEICWNADDVWT